MNWKPNQPRRKVMKAIASGSICGTTLGVGSAAAESKEKEFVGVAYRPVTHDIVGKADGTIARPNNSMVQGTLHVGGGTLHLDETADHVRPFSEVTGTSTYGTAARLRTRKFRGAPLKAKQFGWQSPSIERGLGLSVDLTSVSDGGVSGMLGEKPEEKVAFIAEPKPQGVTRTEIRNRLKERVVAQAYDNVEQKVYR